MCQTLQYELTHARRTEKAPAHANSLLSLVLILHFFALEGTFLREISGDILQLSEKIKVLANDLVTVFMFFKPTANHYGKC